MDQLYFCQFPCQKRGRADWTSRVKLSILYATYTAQQKFSMDFNIMPGLNEYETLYFV